MTTSPVTGAEAPASAPASQKFTIGFVFPMLSGHINPSLAVARSLVADGHAVHYVAREQMRKAIEDTGAVLHIDAEVVLATMGTVLTGDSPDIGWEARPAGADGQPRGLRSRELCRAAWAGVFDAFGSESADKGALILVAVGPQADPLGDLKPPPNAVCLPTLPQVDILRVGVDVFLTHGGQNSFSEGLANGAPLVVCPGFGDQVENACRAESLGAGLQVPRPDPDEGAEADAISEYRRAVAQALARAASEPSFKAAAGKCMDRLRSAGGVPRAVALIAAAAANGGNGAPGAAVAEGDACKRRKFSSPLHDVSSEAVRA